MLKCTVDGDAKSGFIVNIHDGDHSESYTPKAESAEEAGYRALQDHHARYHPDEQPTVGDPPAAPIVPPAANAPAPAVTSVHEDPDPVGGAASLPAELSAEA